MNHWYFAYGPSTSIETFSKEFTVLDTQVSSLRDYRLSFAITNVASTQGTSCLVPSIGGTVLGVSYLIDETTLKQICDTDITKEMKCLKIQGEQNIIEAYILFPKYLGRTTPPDDLYLAKIREGLTGIYPVTVVDAYLQKALGREKLFTTLFVQRAADAVYSHEYNCLFRRIYPWRDVVRTSAWGCATGLLAPGEISTVHNHDEEETAIILSGEGEAVLDEGTTKLVQGDIIYHPPGSSHSIRNTMTSGNLCVLFIWWGGQEAELREKSRMQHLGGPMAYSPKLG